MKIIIELIKELRNKTKAGLSDCKKFLEQTNGDLEAAAKLLKEKSLCYYKTKKTKENFEGLTNILIQNNKAVLYELKAETDFVVKNQNFMDLYNKIGDILLKVDSSVQNLDDFLNYRYEGQSIKELILEKSFIIKEQIILSRIQVVYKKDKESFGFYKHQGGKISSLVHLDGFSQDVQEHLPVHIVGMKPKFLKKELVDKSFIEEENNISLKQVQEKNINRPLKPELVEKIVQNRLESVLKKVCLLEQPFYIDENQQIKEYLAKNKVNVIAYYCFES
ncbi:elongation factor Ts [Candidatus Phytoplasma luffae]|uniref:Elongation factor Ts n=1 Tax=Loofah witches'-broom phytoplasma TaxID=35773 RepID=A0A975IM66_LOWBP|nr:translation elongation factor Ts [Candidatus Phytoplasma luffae]QTX03140.1 elongation factor Ts [Candidatus Phytoplasma luffae]